MQPGYCERLFLFLVLFLTFLGANDAPRDSLQYVLWIGSQTKFLTKLWTFENSRSLISLYGDFTRSQICHDKTTFRSKTDPTNKFLNLGNGLIVFSSSSSTHRHTSTSTRSCYNIYSRLWELSVPTLRIFEDFRGFWLGTCNIYPRCPAKNIWNFPIKIFSIWRESVVS